MCLVEFDIAKAFTYIHRTLRKPELRGVPCGIWRNRSLYLHSSHSSKARAAWWALWNLTYVIVKAFTYIHRTLRRPELCGVPCGIWHSQSLYVHSLNPSKAQAAWYDIATKPKPLLTFIALFEGPSRVMRLVEFDIAEAFVVASMAICYESHTVYWSKLLQ